MNKRKYIFIIIFVAVIAGIFWELSCSNIFPDDGILTGSRSMLGLGKKEASAAAETTKNVTSITIQGTVRVFQTRNSVDAGSEEGEEEGVVSAEQEASILRAIKRAEMGGFIVQGEGNSKSKFPASWLVSFLSPEEKARLVETTENKEEPKGKDTDTDKNTTVSYNDTVNNTSGTTGQTYNENSSVVAAQVNVAAGQDNDSSSPDLFKEKEASVLFVVGDNNNNNSAKANSSQNVDIVEEDESSNTTTTNKSISSVPLGVDIPSVEEEQQRKMKLRERKSQERRLRLLKRIERANHTIPFMGTSVMNSAASLLHFRGFVLSVDIHIERFVVVVQQLTTASFREHFTQSLNVSKERFAKHLHIYYVQSVALCLTCAWNRMIDDMFDVAYNGSWNILSSVESELQQAPPATEPFLHAPSSYQKKENESISTMREKNTSTITSEKKASISSNVLVAGTETKAATTTAIPEKDKKSAKDVDQLKQASVAQSVPERRGQNQPQQRQNLNGNTSYKNANVEKKASINSSVVIPETKMKTTTTTTAVPEKDEKPPENVDQPKRTSTPKGVPDRRGQNQPQQGRSSSSYKDMNSDLEEENLDDNKQQQEKGSRRNATATSARSLTSLNADLDNEKDDIFIDDGTPSSQPPTTKTPTEATKPLVAAKKSEHAPPSTRQSSAVPISIAKARSDTKKPQFRGGYELHRGTEWFGGNQELPAPISAKKILYGAWRGSREITKNEAMTVANIFPWFLFVAVDVRFPPFSLHRLALAMTRVDHKAPFWAHTIYNHVDVMPWNTIVTNPSILPCTGYFDENYFPAYYEDFDFETRLRYCKLAQHRLKDIIFIHPKTSVTRRDKLKYCRHQCGTWWVNRMYYHWKWQEGQNSRRSYGNSSLSIRYWHPPRPMLYREVVLMQRGKGKAYKTLCNCKDSKREIDRKKKKKPFHALPDNSEEGLKKRQNPMYFFASNRLLSESRFRTREI